MTIDEAIKILTDYTSAFHSNFNRPNALALKLGIEALKARKVWQDNEGFDPAEALPGETS